MLLQGYSSAIGMEATYSSRKMYKTHCLGTLNSLDSWNSLEELVATNSLKICCLRLAKRTGQSYVFTGDFQNKVLYNKR